MRRNGQGLKSVTDGVEHHGHHCRHHTGNDTEDGIPEILRKHRSTEPGWNLEQGLPADKKSVHRIGHYRGKEGEDEGSGVELHVTVEHLDGKDCRADRRAKDCRKAGGHADEHEKAPFLIRAVGEGGIHRAEAGGDLRYGPFPA